MFDKISALKKIALSPDYIPDGQSALDYRPDRQSALDYRPDRQSALDYKRYPISSLSDAVYSRKNVQEDHSEFFEKIRRMNKTFENTVKANPGKSRKEVSIALKKYFRQQKQKGN